MRSFKILNKLFNIGYGLNKRMTADMRKPCQILKQKLTMQKNSDKKRGRGIRPCFFVVYYPCGLP